MGRAHFFALCALVGCSSDTTSSPDAAMDSGAPDAPIVRDGGFDAEAEAASEASADAGMVPLESPGVFFFDGDPTCNEVSGPIQIVVPMFVTDITSFNLYWGSDPMTPLSAMPFATVPWNAPMYMLPKTSVPMGATCILAFSKNAAGENPVPGMSPLNEGSFVDISAGQGAMSGIATSAAIDVANQKLLVAANDNGKLGLFRCSVDGTSCAFTDISAGQPTSSATSPSAVIDAANSKLLVVTQNDAAGAKPGLFRCNLDGTSCTYTDIGAASTGYEPSASIDVAGAKLLVATRNNANGDRPALVRCNLDGTSCGLTDISAGQPANSGHSPTLLVDAANGKILVTTDVGKPLLFRCNIDGSSCAFINISAMMGGIGPSAALDVANGKLLVGTSYNMNHVALIRCDVDGTNCGFTEISGGVFQPAMNLRLAVDPVHSKVIEVDQLGIRQCNLDGTNCALTNQFLLAGSSPLWDAANQRVRLAFPASNQKPGLFTPCPR